MQCAKDGCARDQAKTRYLERSPLYPEQGEAQYLQSTKWELCRKPLYFTQSSYICFSKTEHAAANVATLSPMDLGKYFEIVIYIDWV